MPTPNPSTPRDNLRARLGLSAEREGDLRARLVNRDERALVELIEVTLPWLLGMVQAMLQDHDDAQDVLLDTYRTVWDKIEPGGPTGLLLPLVFRVGRNKAIDRLRRRRRRLGLMSRFRVHAAAEVALSRASPESAAHPGWPIHARVREALADLPEDQRTVIDLAYFQGLTHGEIATALTIPLGTVKTRLRLAYGKLRGALKGLKGWSA